MPYNPFNKPIGSPITAEDLNELIGKAAEGYYLEYKETFPNPKKIAHSIASLANTFGGWYIVGVQTDDNHTASKICGFSTGEFPDPVAKVRDVVKMRIDPVPVFYAWPVSLNEDRTVLVVHVPANQRTPYVTDDGRVYRRNHDSSDPVPEDRRHTLDHLFESGKRVAKEFERFCRSEKGPSIGSDNVGWVNLFLMPEPLGLTEKPELVSPSGIADLVELSRRPRQLLSLKSTATIVGNLPFNHAQICHDSIRLRQGSLGQLTNPSVVAEMFSGGSARFHIPVRFDRLLRFRKESRTSTKAQEILNSIIRNDPTGRADASRLRFFDAGQILLSVLLFVAFYEEWLGDMPWRPDFRVGFSFRGFEDAVPFFDADAWAEQVEEWGLPILEENLQVPDPWGDNSIYHLEKDDGLGISLILDIGLSLGLSLNSLTPSLQSSIAQASRQKDRD